MIHWSLNNDEYVLQVRGDNEVKKKIIIFSILLPVGVIISLYLTAIVHFSIGAEILRIHQLTLNNCIRIIATDETAQLLFLCFNAVMVLCIVVLLFVRKGSAYESELKNITEKISTPVSAGQKQHGSAKWLGKREFDQCFEHFELDTNNPFIAELINRGFDDIKYNDVEVIKNDSYKALGSGGTVIGMYKNKHINKDKEKEKLYYIGDDIHTLCIGATRSGKSRCVVLQSIGFMGLAGESMIVSDPKGELYQYTHPFLQRLGYEIITLDFKNPLKSSRYNFLQNVIDAVNDDDIPKAIDYAWDITSSLVGEAKGERIWNDGEASVIVSSILAVVYDNKSSPEYQNLTNVYYFIANMCQMANKELPLNKYMKTLSPTHPAKALLGIADVAPSRTRGSFFTAALTTLRLFTNPLIYSMTCASDFRPRETGVKKRALFMILPDEKTTYYSLASLFVAQHYELLVNVADNRGGRLERRVNFVLDEFGNFTQIPAFTNKLTAGGGRGIRFNLFVQSLAQIEEKYGRENAITVKGNCAIWIYLCADEPQTLDEISKRLGNYTVATHSKSSSCSHHSSGSSSASVNLTGRALLTADEVRLMDRPNSIITSRNNPAILHAPDLFEYAFNKMFGLGDKEHNRNVREKRENKRVARVDAIGDIRLWNIWNRFNNSAKNYHEKKAGCHPADLE